MGWADEIRTLKVRTNADTPTDAAQAYAFGAEGIGLCRTEHMFFEADRIAAIREMIVAKTVEQRKRALAKLLPMQQRRLRGHLQGHERLFRSPSAIWTRRCTNFCPMRTTRSAALADEMGITFDDLKATVDSLHEFNPMLGHRGCRLAVTYPEIAEMQTRAVIEAAINVNEEAAMNVAPEIMIPLVGDVKELKYVKNVVTATADAIIAEAGVQARL